MEASGGEGRGEREERGEGNRTINCNYRTSYRSILKSPQVDSPLHPSPQHLQCVHHV